MKKNAVVYGVPLTDVMKRAISVLSESLLDYAVAYPVCIPADGMADTDTYRCFYIGTRENNAQIRAEFADASPEEAAALSHPEGYAIRVHDDTVWIAGADASGVLWGCVDFYSKYLVKNEFTYNDLYVCNPLAQALGDFAHASAPDVAGRGIWTWGHVIYDYRGFLDHMVRLKMNTLIVWNDYVPVNAAEMIAYAHTCGIRVIWGFAWCWDTDCTRFSMDALDAYGAEIFEKYEREYAHLGGDGIYFQSFTELNTERIGDVLIAEAVTGFVNRTASRFFEKYPDLELQFGLHAESVRNRLEYIAQTDPRIRIVWENCGAFPFAYHPHEIGNFDATCAFVRDIAHLRGEDDCFGVVTKGLTKLDWLHFEHLGGSANIGVSSAYMKDDRVRRKHKIWKYVQAYWLTHAGYAQEMVRLMAEAKQGELHITALVEDGMFEETIMYPVALYAEMLWDSHADLSVLMSDTALREDVVFA